MKAFVLMPFDPEFRSIFDDLIQPALKDAGFDVTRADSFLDQQNILRDIVGGIGHADLIVADLTTLNPNVLYELGLCHGLGIPTLMLAQSMDDIPFDLRPYRIQLYSTRFDHVHKLKSAITEIAKKHKDGEISFGSPVTDFLSVKRATIEASQISASPSLSATNAPLEAQEEKGLLDFLLDGMKAAKQLTQILGDIAEETLLMDAKANAHGATLVNLAANPGLGAPAQAHRVATVAAADMNQYTEKLEGLSLRLNENVESFSENLGSWLTLIRIHSQEEQADAHEFRKQVQILLNTVHNSAESLRGYRQAVASLKGMTREMNSASRRLVQALDTVIACTSKIEAFCVRATDLVDDKLHTITVSGS
jgi:nucleoside 2-deoxyribosyltransferase